MRDDDLTPLLHGLADEASAHATLRSAEAVRRHGDHRRIGRHVVVTVAAASLALGGIGLVTRGTFGPDIPAGHDVIGSILHPSPTTSTEPVPDATAGGTTTVGSAPSQGGTETAPAAGHATTVTHTATTTSAPPTSSAPTATTSTSPEASPTTTGPALPAGVTPPGPGTVLTFDGAVGSRVAFGSGTLAQAGGAGGVLPYTPLAATTVRRVNWAAADPGALVLGVDPLGVARLHAIDGGKEDWSVAVGTGWTGVSALLALEEEHSRQLTVIAFQADGRVLRHVIAGAWKGLTPTLDKGTALIGPGGPTSAVALCDYQLDGQMLPSHIEWFAVEGRNLVRKSVNRGDTSIVVGATATGDVTGVTQLAYISTETGQGVVAWNGTGPGALYFGPIRSRPLVFVGPGPARP